MLELAADLRLLDEPVDHLGPVAVPRQQDLDGQVAPQVRVAAFEDGPHATAGDLAQELIAAGAGVGDLLGARADRRALVLLRVEQQDAWDRAVRLGQRLQHATVGGRAGPERRGQSPVQDVRVGTGGRLPFIRRLNHGSPPQATSNPTRRT